jgi:heme-degrading monooxygenase HmoA
MFARVSTYEGDAEALREGFERVTGPLEQLDGFERAYFMVDRDSGRAMSVTLWESREALETSTEAANRLRDDATQPSDAAIKSVDSYEVAVTAGG